MSFDIDFLFNTPPADLVSRIQTRWRQFNFPAQLRLRVGNEQKDWLVETPIPDEYPQAPGLWQGEDAMYVEICPSGAAHEDAEVAELHAQFSQAGRISVSGAAGMNAFIVASTLAEALDGVVWDPQGVLGDVIELSRFREHPDQISLEERGYFMADVLAKMAERFWKNESGGYQKTIALYAQPEKSGTWLDALKALLKPSNPPAANDKLTINLVPLRKRRGIKSSASRPDQSST